MTVRAVWVISRTAIFSRDGLEMAVDGGGGKNGNHEMTLRAVSVISRRTILARDGPQPSEKGVVAKMVILNVKSAALRHFDAERF